MQRKKWNQLRIEKDEENNMVIVETLLKFFESQRDWIIFSRPFSGTKDEIKEAITCQKNMDGTYPTEHGETIIRHLFNLPFVETVLFKFSDRFVVKAYAPFNLFDQVIAEVIVDQIKKCVEKTAGEELTIVNDLLAEDLYEEIPAPA